MGSILVGIGRPASAALRVARRAGGDVHRATLARGLVCPEVCFVSRKVINGPRCHPREPREADGWSRDHRSITARYTADNRPFHGPHSSPVALAIRPSRRSLRSSSLVPSCAAWPDASGTTTASCGPLGVGGRPPVPIPMPAPWRHRWRCAWLDRTQCSNSPGCRVAVLNAAVESAGPLDGMPTCVRAV